MRLLAHNTIGLWAISLLLLCEPSGVRAAIYACPTGDGTTVFQDRPCPRAVPVETPAMQAARAPLGIHDSWFVKPLHAEGRAFCDKRGCECGPHERRHNGSLARAVADALYMDTGWHRYDISEALWLETPVNSARRYDSRAEMTEASCAVMMSQQLLKQFAEDVSAKLRQMALQAEERGYDIPDPCDAGDDLACDYYDAMILYQRLARDAKALHISREMLGTSSQP